MKDKRLKHCPECETKLVTKGLTKKTSFVECPKCGFREKYKRRGRVKEYFVKGDGEWRSQ